MTIRPRRGDQGFTLIELLIAIAIIGLLAAIAVPLFTNQQASASLAAAQEEASAIDSLAAVTLSVTGDSIGVLTSTGEAPNIVWTYVGTSGSMTITDAGAEGAVRLVPGDGPLTETYCVSVTVNGQTAVDGPGAPAPVDGVQGPCPLTNGGGGGGDEPPPLVERTCTVSPVVPEPPASDPGSSTRPAPPAVDSSLAPAADPAGAPGTSVMPALNALQTRDASLNVTWPAATNTPTAYNIYYTADGQNWTLFETNPAADRTSLITGLTNGTPYWVRVTAVNAAGEGAGSIAGPAVPGPTPAVPANVTATAVSGSELDVQWSPVTHATNYVVRWRRTGTSIYSPALYVMGTSFRITGLENDKDYDISVAAQNATGTSVANIIGPISPTSLVPAGASGLTATVVEDNSIRLDWSSPADAAGFDVNVTTPDAPFTPLSITPALRTGITETPAPIVSGTPPPTPRGISVLNTPNGLLATWRPVVLVGSPAATEYRAVVQQGSTFTYGEWTTNTYDLITGLTPGAIYSVGAQARNSSGATSSISTDSMFQWLPDGPFAFSQRVLWDWFTDPAEASTFTLSGVQPGETYYFTVRTVNEYGLGGRATVGCTV